MFLWNKDTCSLAQENYKYYWFYAAT